MKRQEIHTPCYIIDVEKLEDNLKILNQVEQETGCKILLAQKAFSCFPLYSLIGKYISGTAASGLYEARLGKEEMGKETHVFSAAYREDEVEELVKYADHMVFNSVSQLAKFGTFFKEKGKSMGLRINPECSTQEGHEIYDPCAKGSRLGVTLESFEREMTPELLALLDGFHFHTLCEQNSDDLEKTLVVFEEKFRKYFSGLKWINFGGGHHITREDYDLECLKRCICHVQDTYGVQVYLEPGEAVALNAGELDTTVLDITENSGYNAILDTSAACHMPDVLEMPYRPPLKDSFEAEEKTYTYRLGGPTCLSGDYIGTYSFETPLHVGDRLTFQDMAIYSMVKNNTFNGMPLPSIVLKKEQENYEVLRSFSYSDFKGRLG